jgi:pimeloyl-ACP methyl ester carboxylesterase
LQVIRDASLVPSPTLAATLELGDGRRLAYAAAGPARGYPIVYLHGAMGSPRWRTPALDAAIAGAGVRFVVLNRPGFGGSDEQVGRTVASHAEDVRELADALGWTRFSVLGVSAGAPYALACAWAMAERVAHTAAVCCLPPPPILAPRGRLRGRYLVPLAAFGAPWIGTALAGVALRAAGMQSATPPRAMVEDYLVCCREWGFPPADIRTAVTFWHARHDRLVPLAHARAFAATVPSAAIELTPRGGHFFLRTWIAEIVASLVERSSHPRPARAVAA